MSSMVSPALRTGYWIDWERGSTLGATWTIQKRDGALLQSFTAIFTTFVFTQLWFIIAFVLYYARSSRSPEDGLRHQRQVILRNDGAMVSALLFGKQALRWHGKASRARRRSLVWMLGALSFAIAAGVTSSFTGYATSRASPNRLVSGTNCGYPTIVAGNGYLDSLAQYTAAAVNDTIAAASYARSCYDVDAASTGQCSRYIRPQLGWTGAYNTPCPFESGICSNGDQAAFTLTSQDIDSLADLGINSPKRDRLILHKRMTCSSIREINDYSQTGPLVYYNFGPILDATNATFVYNRLAEAALISYSLASQYSYADFPSSWSPINALNRTDADVSIIFISSNTVVYAFPNDDPVFSATNLDGNFYRADYDVSTVACAEQYQICNPARGMTANCSPWMGAAQFALQTAYLQSNSDPPLQTFWQSGEAQLSSRQLAILGRIAYVLPQTSTYNAIATRQSSALRLQDTLFNFIQTKQLPDDYWTSEIGWWFDACLARLQEGIMSFATGTAGSTNTTLGDSQTQDLCNNQLTRDIGDSTINFSVLAMAIIYSFGVLIIGLSLSMETLAQILCKNFWTRRAFIHKMWKEDDVLSLHRRAFEASAFNDGAEQNDDTDVAWASGSVPVTTQRTRTAHFSIGAECVENLLTPVADHTELEMANLAQPQEELKPVVVSRALTLNRGYGSPELGELREP